MYLTVSAEEAHTIVDRHVAPGLVTLVRLEDARFVAHVDAHQLMTGGTGRTDVLASLLGVFAVEALLRDFTDGVASFSVDLKAHGRVPVRHVAAVLLKLISAVRKGRGLDSGPFLDVRPLAGAVVVDVDINSALTEQRSPLRVTGIEIRDSGLHVHAEPAPTYPPLPE